MVQECSNVKVKKFQNKTKHHFNVTITSLSRESTKYTLKLSKYLQTTKIVGANIIFALDVNDSKPVWLQANSPAHKGL